MPTEEELKLRAKVVTQTSQLDTLIAKLELADQVANRLDDSTIDIEVNDGEVDALIAKLSALESGDLFSGDTLLGDVNADIFDDIDASDLAPNLDDVVEEVEFDASVLSDLPDSVLDNTDVDVLDDVDADVLDNTDADVLGELPDDVLDNIDTDFLDDVDADVLSDSDENELASAVRALEETLDQEFTVTQEQQERPASAAAARAADSDSDSSDSDDDSVRDSKDVVRRRLSALLENTESVPLPELIDTDVESPAQPDEILDPPNELDDIASRGIGGRIEDVFDREDIGGGLPATTQEPIGNEGLPATLSSFGGEEQTSSRPLEQVRRLKTQISVDPEPLRDLFTDFEIENFQRDDDGRIIREGALPIVPSDSQDPRPITVEPEGFERIEMGPEGPPDPEQVAGLPVVADNVVGNERAGSRSGFSTRAQKTFNAGTFSDVGQDVVSGRLGTLLNNAEPVSIPNLIDTDDSYVAVTDSEVKSPDDASREDLFPDANPRDMRTVPLSDLGPTMREVLTDRVSALDDAIHNRVSRGSDRAASAVNRATPDDTRSRLLSQAGNAFSRFNELAQTRVGLTKFYDVLAIFVPTLLAFQATMPLVIGGLYSLAAAALASTAALGAIGGLGLLGAAQNEAGGAMPSQEDFGAVFDGVGEDFVEAFRPITERLAPLFEDAVDALGPLFDRLAGVSEQLLDLKGPVRDLGGFVADNLVEGLNSTLAFARAAVPLFSAIGDAVEDINLARAFAGVLADAIPTLAAFSSIIVQSLPGILEFARGMSLVTRSVLFLTSEIVGLLDPLLELIPGIDSGVAALGTLAGIALTASTATLLYGKVLALATSSQLAFVAAKLKSLAAYAGTIVMSKLAAAGVSFFGAAAAGAAAGVLTLATAVGLLTGGLTILAGTLAGLGAGFTSMGSDVSDATDELEAFSQQRDSMVGRNTAMMGDLDRDVYVNVTQDNSTTVEGNADAQSMATLSAQSDGDSFKPGELPPGVYNA